MTKNNDNSLQNQIIAMSNTLAEKSTRFNAAQQRLFYVSLAALKRGINANNEVEIDKEDLFEYLHITNSHRHADLRKSVVKLMQSSFVQFGTDEEFCDGFLIVGARTTRKKIYIGFNAYFLPLIQELADNYVRLLDDDVTSFDSKFSMMLYQNLLKDKWMLTNPDFYGIPYSTKKLKMIFGLSKDDYMTTKKGKPSFNRTLFERFTINKAVEEINEKSKCIVKLRYEKIKKGNRIQAYEFYFDYVDPNTVRRENNEKRQRENSVEALSKGKRIARNQQLTIHDCSDDYSDDVKNLEWWNR